MTFPSYMLSLQGKNCYTWASLLRYIVVFKTQKSLPVENSQSWLIYCVDSLAFSGKHSHIGYATNSYAVDLEEDLTLLLVSFGDHIKYVFDTKADDDTGCIIFGGP